MKPRIVIAEDDFLIREGALVPTISADFEIVATVGDGEAAIAAVEKYRPEIVLLDVSLPVLRGFDAARRIRSAQPECKVIFVTNYWELAYVEAAKEMGASGYVFKSRVTKELSQALSVALDGGFYQSTR